ncbi:SixA phosphatase family protein [Aliarcobacter butzleri]|uniref:SixA phosphatase family protein n=1 Tax=Aliarcobacter butzleri TaxID=28197 RepID=UPI001EDBA5AD|nr:histidine phosphatase family protein [Aliarcobacter butzleri]MCG3687520.1 histidine phosphatase family protein [Aliarcobacter butzleri]MDS1314894.1 histidine phosphatase family protein [Aliarcobacter butzleri]
MKKLYLVRHTTKDDEKSNNYDYDIELSEDGKEKAKIMAQNFAKKNPNIDLIVASPAIRTRQTAEIFVQELNYNKTVMLNEVLYMAFLNELLETITYTYDTVDSMLLVGHNPSLTALGVTLVGFKEKFEEGAIMEIEFDCNSWIDISKNNAKLISYEKPL